MYVMTSSGTISITTTLLILGTSTHNLVQKL